MQQFFTNNNHSIVQDPDESDIIIVGLCAAFNADELRSSKILSAVRKHKKVLYVYGCLSKISPEKISEKNVFNSWDHKLMVEDIVKNPIIPYGSIILPAELRTKEDYRIYNNKKYFVGISSGCSFDCSYCTHKIGVGGLVSRPPDEILTQIKSLLKAEIIVLTGTDTACYGLDIGTNFPELLEKILKISNDSIKYHIAQFNPEGLVQELISCCSDNRITDMQLPIQTYSIRLLKSMRRNYSPINIQKFIEAVRRKNENIIFRTDLLVGYPTETMDELEESINFAIKNFDEIAVYGYEYKKNTPISLWDNISFYDEIEISRRVYYATTKLISAKKLVHSGGQNISSLIQADSERELLRMKRAI